MYKIQQTKTIDGNEIIVRNHGKHKKIDEAVVHLLNIAKHASMALIIQVPKVIDNQFSYSVIDGTIVTFKIVEI